MRPVWRTRVVGLTAVAAVAIGGGVALLRPHDRPTEFVVVAEFTTDSADRGIADYLAEATRRGLSASYSMGAAPDARVMSARRRLRVPPNARLTDSLARQIALGEGIRSMVTGSLTRRGERRFALQIRLISAETGEQLGSDERLAVAEEALIPVLDTMTRTLRQRAGDDLAVIRAQPSLLALTSTSLEAMLAYMEARRLPAKAVPLLRKAVALDSTFAIALWQLAFQMHDEERPDERRDLLKKAYDNRERLTDYERLRVEAAYLYSPDGKMPSRRELEMHLRQIVDKYPNAPDAMILADFYLRRRDMAAAESAYKRVIALDSNEFLAHTALVNIYLATGRYAAARTAADALTRRFGPNPWDAFVFYADGKRDKARESLETALRKSTMLGPAVDQRNVALINLLEGRLADWEHNLSIADSIQGGRPPFSRVRLWANFWVRQRPNENARSLDSIASNPRARHIDLAEYYAQAGRATEARAHLRAYESLVKDTFYSGSAGHLVMGWINLAENKPREAVVEFLASQNLPDGPAGASDINVDPQVGLAYERAGIADSAIATYEHYLKRSNIYMTDEAYKLVWVLEHVAPLYANRGDRAKAKAAYERIADVWKNADAELQPRVKHAQAEIARLSR